MRRLLVPIFVIASFLSACVLFGMQPFVARALLPRYGGAPHVWVTTAVFFQVSVLFGYGYAHAVTTRLTTRRLALVHTAVGVAAACSFHPRTLVLEAVPGGFLEHVAPVLRLLSVLAASVGLPAFFLSATSPIVQALVTKTEAIKNPYKLYIASNSGSLLALLVYPFVIDPYFGLRAQASGLAATFVVATLTIVASTVLGDVHAVRLEGDLVSAAGAAGAVGLEEAGEGGEAAGVTSKLTWSALRERSELQLRWFVLAFAPSLLLSSMTLHVTTDVLAIPLFWVFPLGIYLVSFMVAFSRYGPSMLTASRRCVPLLGVLIFCVLHEYFATIFAIVPHALFLFFGAMGCHGLLAQLKPPPAGLTRFYFVMSLGGAAGGIFCSLLAPWLFRDLLEYPLAIMLVIWLLIAGSERVRAWFVCIPIGFAAVTFALGRISTHSYFSGTNVTTAAFCLPLLAAYAFSRHRIRFTAALLGIFAASIVFWGEQYPYRNRSFFGSLRVTRSANLRYTTLVSGTTSHGVEDAEALGKPLAYYHESGPAGDFFRVFDALPQADGGRSVLAIGLGIGALGGYAKPGDRWSFFEISELDIDVARNSGYFHALSLMRAPYEIILGDGRLELAKRDPLHAPGNVLVVDAFSSDMIPIHLLTLEAARLYDQHASDALLFHLSNQFANLVPTTAAVVRDVGLDCRVRSDLAQDKNAAIEGKNSSIWLVASRHPSLLSALESQNADWRKPVAAARAWTDDKADVARTLTVHF